MKPKRLPELSGKDLARFWSKVDQKGVNECWPWLGTVALTDNRGNFSFRKGFKRTLKAPRIVYALHFGVDPFPQQVLHNCNNANCVNPHHLYLGDAKDNSVDSDEAGTKVCGKILILQYSQKQMSEKSKLP